MNQLILDCPANALSFGQVSFNILKELYRKNVNTIWLPTSNNVDFSAFEIEEDFKKWLQSASSNINKRIKPDIPCLKLWHLNGSQKRIGAKQFLYSFYELDEPTDSEVNLAKFQNKVWFSSHYAADKFKEKGVDAGVAPCGFDESFYKTEKQYLNPDVVHFGLMGKFEKRKHTEKIIKLWLSKYGNNNKYQLSVLVTNPFFNKEENKNLLSNCLEGKRYSNINFLPYLKKNSEVNDFLNAIDIDLTGLSGAEGFNLPSFNASCLGKWSIILNATAHKDWANNTNCILVEPNGKQPCYDNKFFQEGAEFNQGSIYTWDRDNVSQCMDIAASKKGKSNTEGEKLKQKFSYSKSVDLLIKGIQDDS